MARDARGTGRARGRAALLLLGACLLVAGCSREQPEQPRDRVQAPPQEAATTTQAPQEPAAARRFPKAKDRAPISIVATATVPKVGIYPRAEAAKATRQLGNPQPSGAPLVFLVQEQRPDGWLKVLLPVRPNGSTGWIRADQVTLSQHNYLITIRLKSHRITVTKGDEVIVDEPVGVGAKQTPTPGGLYYTKELLKAPDPDGPYGPYAFGLSGFSEVLKTFAGGPGDLGIHGTNRPDLLGKDVSHGCIRMSNEGITKLAKTLPLGVPVRIYDS